MKSEARKRNQEGPQGLSSITNGKLLLFFVAIGLLVYLPQLSGGFIIDDVQYVQHNPNLTSLHALLNWSQFWSGRTLYWLSLFIEKQLWGNNPLGFKVVNLVAHILTAFFLFLFLRQLNRLKPEHDGFFAVAAGGLFLVSPLAVEAVSYISGRNNCIGGMFFILGGWLVLKSLDPDNRNRMRLLLGAILSFVAAFLFKEVYIVSLVLGPMLVIWVKKPRGRKLGIVLLGAFASFLILSSILYWAPGSRFQTLRNQMKNIAAGSENQALATNAYSVAYSLRLFAFPDELNIDHDLPVLGGFSDSRAWIAIAFLAGLALLLFSIRKILPYSLFSYISYLILIAPSNSLLLRHGNWMVDPLSERNLYAPAMFVSIILAEILYRIFSRKRTRLIAFTALVLIFGSRTLFRTVAFSDPLKLWEDAVSDSPNRPRPHLSLSGYLLERGNIKLAIEHAEMAIKLDPSYAPSYLALYQAQKAAGKLEDAIHTLQTGLQSSRRDTKDQLRELGALEFSYGNILYAMGDYKQARRLLENSIHHSPQLLISRIKLLFIDLYEEKMDAAGKRIDTIDRLLNEGVREFRSMVPTFEPVRPLFLFAKGWYAFLTGDPELGVELCKQSIDEYPQFTEPYLKLGEHYFLQQEYDTSAKYFDLASQTPRYENYKRQIQPYLKGLAKYIESKRKNVSKPENTRP